MFLGGYETILLMYVFCDIIVSIIYDYVPFCFHHSKAKLQLIWQKNMVTKKSFHYWKILKKQKRSVFMSLATSVTFPQFSFTNFSCAACLIRYYIETGVQSCI